MPLFRRKHVGRAPEPPKARQSPLAIQAHQIDAAQNPTDSIRAITHKARRKRPLAGVNDARPLDAAV